MLLLTRTVAQASCLSALFERAGGVGRLTLICLHWALLSTALIPTGRPQIEAPLKRVVLTWATLDNLSGMKLKIGSMIEWLLRVENLPF